ncbi:MAG: SVM family protein [Candidatus Phytoplasma stylosanthis]|nr:SVM family protein [Candidatus Phytoplasma stylosanthis]
MLVKNKLHLLPFFLISCLGLLFVINNNQVMAMENNNPLKTIYSIQKNEKKKNTLKISYYIKDKNLSLEDMAKEINIINSKKQFISKL